MLITFKSKAAADIVMYREHAQRILDLLGKNADRGIIVHAELKAAIATIEAAMADSRAHSISTQSTHHTKHENLVESVSFSSRAYPLLQMLREADKRGNDVVWGV